jgi:predicted ester cyclase
MSETIERIKEVALRDFELWNTGDLAIADETIAADYKRYDFDTLHEGRGPEFVKGLVTMYRTAFPDLHLTIEEMSVADDVVITRWRSAATHTGEFQGLAPTGAAAEVTGVTIARTANGKIVEERVFMDSLKLAQVVGAIPK